jgi:hypothetical protein
LHLARARPQPRFNDAYIDANTGTQFTQAVVMVLDAEMSIAEIRGTSDEDDQGILEQLVSSRSSRTTRNKIAVKPRTGLYVGL